MFTRTFIMLCLALVLFPVSLHAQEITETEGARLQNVFQTLLENKKNEKNGLILKGDVTVEAAETYYAITLPQITLNDPDGIRLEIGLISINATPHNKPGQFKMTMALPTPILEFNQAGQETIRITIGKQKTAGIWHETLENFIKLDSLYSDIQIKLNGGATTASIPEALIRYNLEEDENGRWSGPTYFESSNIQISSAEGPQASLGKIALSLALDQFAPQALKKSEETNAHSVSTLTNGANLKFILENFSASKTNIDGENESIAFQSAGINAAYSNALSGLLNLNFGFNFKNISETNTPKELSAFLPKSGQLNLTHHNIPIAAISEAIDNSVQNNKLLNFSLLFKIPAILAQVNSYIEIHKTKIENENYEVSLDTVVRADAAATNSATATGKMHFSGFDKTLSLAQVKSRIAGASKYTGQVRALARFLERLKPLARIETSEKNGFIHVFDLEMNKAGQFLINNQNAGLVLNEPESSTPPSPQEPPP